MDLHAQVRRHRPWPRRQRHARIRRPAGRRGSSSPAALDGREPGREVRGGKSPAVHVQGCGHARPFWWSECRRATSTSAASSRFKAAVGEGGQIAVSFSDNNGLDWKEIAKVTAIGLAEDRPQAHRLPPLRLPPEVRAEGQRAPGSTA